MKRILAVVSLWCVAAAGGCGAQQTLLGTEGSYLFTALDWLGPPGEEARLRAQLRGGDFVRAQPGHAVRFYRDGKLFKVAETDADGMAGVGFTPPAPGDYEFTGMPEEPPAPRKLLVACRTPDTRMAIVDLDKTVVASGFHTVLIGRAEPMPDSQDVLRKLAATHTIVYLTHRPDYFAVKSKDWRGEQKYPPGVLLLSTLSGFLSGSGAYKTGAIDRLRKQFSRVEIGIGDKISDAQAYHDNAMKAFLIIQPDGATAEELTRLADALEALDEKAHVVTHWRQIDQVLSGGASHLRPAAQQMLRDRAAGARGGAS